MLVVIRELEAWGNLLKVTKFKFEVWTDHKNLEYFIKAQKLNQRQAIWALYLSRFYSEVYARSTNRKSRWIEQEARSEGGD